MLCTFLRGGCRCPLSLLCSTIDGSTISARERPSAIYLTTPSARPGGVAQFRPATTAAASCLCVNYARAFALARAQLELCNAPAFRVLHAAAMLRDVAICNGRPGSLCTTHTRTRDCNALFVRCLEGQIVRFFFLPPHLPDTLHLRFTRSLLSLGGHKRRTCPMRKLIDSRTTESTTEREADQRPSAA